LGAGLALAGCNGKRDEGPARAGTSAPPSALLPGADASPPAPRSNVSLTQINGQSFPDHVLALTWDDGPDRGSVALADYLHRQKVSATFFVVSEWSKDLSSDPGEGVDTYQTGHTYLRVLGELVGLGHRIGNHTLNHRLLSEIPPETAAEQVRENQKLIDPFVTNELRIFRAPGGAWSAGAAAAIAVDPYLSGLVGPIRWDIDRKDWDSSLACGAGDTPNDCERVDLVTAPHPNQVRPFVMAQRYLASIEEGKHGIVLLHDRVGRVGSSYAIEIARALVPELKARGYVFTAPILRFSPLARRAAPPPEGSGERAIGVADLDGDGRADLCTRDGAGILCATSVAAAGSATDLRPRTVFEGKSRWDLSFGGAAWAPPERAQTLRLVDVDGDRRADVCGLAKTGIVCALATSPRAFAAARPWSAGQDSAAKLLFGDADGDGRSDVCTRGATGIACARSTGSVFEAPKPWLDLATDAGLGSGFTDASALALADVDGDHRADLCGRGPDGIHCALSRRVAFAPADLWSTGGDFGDGGAIAWSKSAYGETIRFGDLNGDGRADVCGRGPAGVVCALSTGRGFTRATLWLDAGMTDADGWLEESSPPDSIHLADVNGDGRADLCADAPGGFVCGLAP
jgi:peptidoglycan/xylan/chitin deacetylase (PgdA/CDA1 family)